MVSLPFAWVVLEIHLDDQVTADRIFLVCGIAVYLDFHRFCAVGVSIWCSHFFDAVISQARFCGRIRYPFSSVK